MGELGKDEDPEPGSPDVSGAMTGSVQARQDAFRVHVEPQIEVLLRVGHSLTGSRADAEDLVQDTLIRAYRAVDRFDGAHPRAWLLTILRNAHHNAHRRRRPAVTDDPFDLETARPAFGAAEGASAEASVVDQTLEAGLERALANLDERFRTVLLLIDVDDLSYVEAAEALGVPVGTVMSRLSRARQKMRAQLRSGGGVIGVGGN